MGPSAFCIIAPCSICPSSQGDGDAVDLGHGRGHDEARQQQGECAHQLRGGRGLRAERLLEELQHDEDAGEARHHEHQRGQQREQAEHDHDADRPAEPEPAGGAPVDREVEARDRLA
jgi:hypothetical protein